MRALRTTAPEASVTVPVIVPVGSLAKRKELRTRANNGSSQELRAMEFSWRILSYLEGVRTENDVSGMIDGVENTEQERRNPIYSRESIQQRLQRGSDGAQQDPRDAVNTRNGGCENNPALCETCQPGKRVEAVKLIHGRISLLVFAHEHSHRPADTSRACQSGASDSGTKRTDLSVHGEIRLRKK